MVNILEHAHGPFSFSLARSEEHGNRYTVVIGSNGSGKSRLLRSLADKTSRSAEGQNLAEVKWPSRTLAVSNLVSDVFKFSTEGEGAYLYLGLRQSTNLLTTGSLRDATVQAVFGCTADKWQADALTRATALIGFSSYSIISEGVSGEPSSREGFLMDLNRSRRDFELPRDIQEQVYEFLSSERVQRDAADYSNIYEVSAVRSFTHFATSVGLEVADLLRMAKRYKFASYKLSFNRGDQSMDSSELSTGQLLLFSMVARIVSSIARNSLVLIDEPETGLHPEWQAAFLPLLKDCLPGELESHIILATHSPHIVSDASDVLLPGDTWGQFVSFNEPHFGQPIESLLYRVFHARVAGNLLVEEDLTIILEFLAGLKSREQMREVADAVERLENVAGLDTPTVMEAILAAKHMIETGL